MAAAAAAAFAAPVPAFCRRGTALVVVADAVDVEEDAGRPTRLLLPLVVPFVFFGDVLAEPPSLPFLVLGTKTRYGIGRVESRLVQEATEYASRERWVGFRHAAVLNSLMACKHESDERHRSREAGSSGQPTCNYRSTYDSFQRHKNEPPQGALETGAGGTGEVAQSLAQVNTLPGNKSVGSTRRCGAEAMQHSIPPKIYKKANHSLPPQSPPICMHFFFIVP